MRARIKPKDLMPELPQQQQAQIIPDGEALERSFSQMQNRNEAVEVLKELFDEKKIYMITDLSREEINLATRIYMISKMKNLKYWQEGLAFLCKLMLSKNRKSRQELLNGMKAYEEKRMQSTNPFNNFQRGMYP